MSTKKRIPLNVVQAPAVGHILTAPPTLIASSHTVEYTCGRCAEVLLHAEEEQVHGLLIQCKACGAYNATDN